jgi:hypothetical protein
MAASRAHSYRSKNNTRPRLLPSDCSRRTPRSNDIASCGRELRRSAVSSRLRRNCGVHLHSPPPRHAPPGVASKFCVHSIDSHPDMAPYIAGEKNSSYSMTKHQILSPWEGKNMWLTSATGRGLQGHAAPQPLGALGDHVDGDATAQRTRSHAGRCDCRCKC